MSAMISVAADLVREAASRKWFLALALAITLLLTMVGVALRMEVVDGALAANRLFGEVLFDDIRPADVALRPVFQAAIYIVFYGGLSFGTLACADFGPSLLVPGRIEHLLALPVRRFELLAGTFLGVITLSVAGALYGAGGFTLILGIKTGVWNAWPVLSGLFASVAFAAIYAAMLTSAVFVRSAALSAAVGVALFVAGIIAGFRDSLSPLFKVGLGRAAFQAATALLPRISSLATAAGNLAGSSPVDARALVAQLGGTALFALGLLALGAWRLEQKDF